MGIWSRIRRFVRSSDAPPRAPADRLADFALAVDAPAPLSPAELGADFAMSPYFRAGDGAGGNLQQVLAAASYCRCAAVDTCPLGKKFCPTDQFVGSAG